MRRQQREPLYLITRLHEPGSIAGTSRPSILVDRPLSFVACIAGRSLASLRFGERRELSPAFPPGKRAHWLRPTRISCLRPPQNPDSSMLELAWWLRAEDDLFVRTAGARELCGTIALISKVGTDGIPDERD